MYQFATRKTTWYGLVTSVGAFLLVQTPSAPVRTTIILT